MQQEEKANDVWILKNHDFVRLIRYCAQSYRVRENFLVMMSASGDIVFEASGC